MRRVVVAAEPVTSVDVTSADMLRELILMQRPQGRDANEAAKQEAGSGKVDCRAANQKSNSQCWQGKRDTKQEGRQEKRGIKY